MTDSQIEISKPYTQKEIVIHSQEELDKLFDDNYHTSKNIVLIDKNLRLRSHSGIKGSWKKGKASCFKHAIKCKNIDAGRFNIESSAKITAHDIKAGNIHCTNIDAYNIDCQDLEAKTVFANAINAGRIFSKNVWVKDKILMNL